MSAAAGENMESVGIDKEENFIVAYERRVISGIEAYKHVAALSLIALPLGAVVAFIEVVFGKGLEAVTGARLANIVPWTAFLPLAGVYIALLYRNFGRGTERGMGLVFDAAEGRADIPAVLAPLVMVSSWLTHLCGGSAGREGVAVQIGATLADQIAQKLQKWSGSFAHSRDTFIICGIAAGFAGLFQTPFAAVFFSLEVLVCGELKYKSLFPATVSAFTSYFVAQKFGLEAMHVEIPAPKLDVFILWKVMLLGLVFGCVGAFFASTLRRTKGFLPRLVPNAVLRAFLFGIALALAFIFLHVGRYSGFGTEITRAALTGGKIYAYDWILKLILTILTLSAGFMGGELTPLFTIGSSLGCILGPQLGLSPEFSAALGFSAVFGSATNTFLAPILIGTECFGAQNLPMLVVVCAVSFFANFDKTIYGSQKQLEI